LVFPTTHGQKQGGRSRAYRWREQEIIIVLGQHHVYNRKQQTIQRSLQETSIAGAALLRDVFQ